MTIMSSKRIAGYDENLLIRVEKDYSSTKLSWRSHIDNYLQGVKRNAISVVMARFYFSFVASS